MVYADYDNALPPKFKSNFDFDGETLKDERVIFSSVGQQQVGCNLKVRKSWLNEFEDGETKQAGALTYIIEFLETTQLDLS